MSRAGRVDSSYGIPLMAHRAPGSSRAGTSVVGALLTTADRIAAEAA